MTFTDPRARIVAALEKIEATKARKTPGPWVAREWDIYRPDDLFDPVARLDTRGDVAAVLLAHGVTFGTGSEPGPVETILREAVGHWDWAMKHGWHEAAFVPYIHPALLLADHINEGETK